MANLFYLTFSYLSLVTFLHNKPFSSGQYNLIDIPAQISKKQSDELQLISDGKK